MMCAQKDGHFFLYKKVREIISRNKSDIFIAQSTIKGNLTMASSISHFHSIVKLWADNIIYLMRRRQH